MCTAAHEAPFRCGTAELLMNEMAIPSALITAARAEGRVSWFDGLPPILAEVESKWSLAVGDPFQPGGQTAWVAPALTARGEERVLKIAWRHYEAEHEADGLRVWAGNGAVRLYAEAEYRDTMVLLLERCRPGRALSGETEDRQDSVIAALLRRLWIEPPARSRFRTLAEMCARWAHHSERRLADGRISLEAELAEHGIALLRSLPASAKHQVLLCTDLHAGNVLSSQREPWLSIDVKPFVGDPAYDVTQHLLNSGRRLHADALDLVTRLSALLDLDRDRVRLWLFARCVHESVEWPELATVARRIALA
jgi:streptomycin 6-kinase